MANIGHDKHGLATYVWRLSVTINVNDLFLSQMYMNHHESTEITTSYKFTNILQFMWATLTLGTQIGAIMTNINSEQLANLITDFKQNGSILSVKWQRSTNPDLCFVSSNDDGT